MKKEKIIQIVVDSGSGNLYGLSSDGQTYKKSKYEDGTYWWQLMIPPVGKRFPIKKVTK